MEALLAGSRMSTVNFAEVVTKYVLRGAAAQGERLRNELPVVFVPVDEDLALQAALMASVTSPFSPSGASQISKDGHIGYVRVNFDEAAGNLPTTSIQHVIDTAQSFDAPGYHVALGGQAISLVAGAKPGPSEGIGIMAAIIIMLLAFG